MIEYSEPNKYTPLRPDKVIKYFIWLCEAFPKLFNPNEIKPLKIGIFVDIIESGKWPRGKVKLSKILRAYCTSTQYKEKIILDANRYDLEGNVTSRVIEKEIYKKKMKA